MHSTIGQAKADASQVNQRFQREPDESNPFAMSPIRIAMTECGKARQDLLKLFDVLEEKLSGVLGPVGPEQSIQPGTRSSIKVCSQMTDMLNEERIVLEHAAVRLSSLIERIEA